MTGAGGEGGEVEEAGGRGGKERPGREERGEGGRGSTGLSLEGEGGGGKMRGGGEREGQRAKDGQLGGMGEGGGERGRRGGGGDGEKSGVKRGRGTPGRDWGESGLREPGGNEGGDGNDPAWGVQGGRKKENKWGARGSRKQLGRVRRVTCGYPWPELEGKGYGMIQDRLSSLIPLSHGNFDVIVGMDWLSKNKAVIVCHEKVVKIPIEEGEILRVHEERTLGAAKALMNAKVGLSLVFIDCHSGIIKSKEDMKFYLTLVLESLRRRSYMLMGDGGVERTRVKSRRVRGMILAAQSEAFKQENVLAERLHALDQQMERKGDESLYFMDRIWVLLVGSVVGILDLMRQNK
ncbi:putative reverse transcriptase domain-containing protein [Tanacetum coccineum]